MSGQERYVNSHLYFLRRKSIYKTVKVYQFDFEPPDGFPSTNMVTERREDIRINDIRGKEDQYSLAKYGFQLVKLMSGMTYADFHDKARIQQKYIPYVAVKLQDLLNAARIQIVSCVIRRRHPEFPIYDGSFYHHKQPSALVHIDTTEHGTEIMIKNANDDKESCELLQRRHMMVNVWKPLKGPVRDWPLTLCDPATVKQETDLVARDLLYVDYQLETYQMHHDAAQKWYFASDQTEDEAWVFVQSDSLSGGIPGVPHTSFPFQSNVETTELRESIELRALVFF